MDPAIADAMEQMRQQIVALTNQLNNQPAPAQVPDPVIAPVVAPVANAPKPERPPTYSGSCQDNLSAWIFQME
jgi:hypothetical protein